MSATTLAGIKAFSSLTSAEREAIAKQCSFRRYQADQEIVSYHDDSRHVYFIVSGQTQVTVFSLSGKQVTLQDLGPGEMFGELSAIDGEPRSAYVLALTDCLVCTMAPNDFWHALTTYPPVAEVTLKRLTWMVRTLNERLFELSVLPVKHRLLAELLRLSLENLSDEQTAEISPCPTHTEIANRIGTHREGVTRELKKLTSNGLIQRDSHALKITNVPQLRTMVREVLGTG